MMRAIPLCMTTKTATIETMATEDGYIVVARWAGVAWQFTGKSASTWLARVAPYRRPGDGVSVDAVRRSAAWARISRY